MESKTDLEFQLKGLTKIIVFVMPGVFKKTIIEISGSF